MADDTTTDAAEARALTDAQLKDAVTELLSHRGERPWRVLRGGQELWETWLPAFRAALRYLPATAEAASEAGEREGLRKALEASLAKRSQPTMDPPYTAAFNAALDMVARDVAPFLVASLPPATDPAMGLDPVTVERCVAMCEQLANGCRAELKDPANDARTISVLDGYIGACTTLARNLAALAAAPTIPATGEAGQ